MAKILIVEDQPDTQALLRHYLQQAGHCVSTAGTAAEALAHWQSDSFELVLLDYLLPDSDGLVLLDQLLAADSASSPAAKPLPPILMLTASQDALILEQAFARGAVDFLRKPFLRSELLARVNNVLGAAAQYQQLNELYKSLNRDLQLAGRVQRLFLPTAPADLACGWYYQPLEGVSGDGLGLREITPGRYVFYLGDVSGHGVQSALLMSALKTCFDSLLDADGLSEPWQLAQGLNQRMEALFDRHYVTLLIGTLDTANGQLSLFNAGHPPPLLLSPGGVRLLAESGSRPIGLQAEISPQAQSYDRLLPGERLLLYSDGLFDASSQGFENFLAQMSGLNWQDLSCEALCLTISQDVQLQDPASADDVTLMALEIEALSYEQHMSASLNEVEAALDGLSDWLTPQGLSVNVFEAVRLSWIEYGNNLVRHGRPNSPVRLQARRRADDLELWIEDEGPAWQLPEFTLAPTHLLAESGRGLWLIHQLSHSFSLERVGQLNRSQIQFKLISQEA